MTYLCNRNDIQQENKNIIKQQKIIIALNKNLVLINIVIKQNSKFNWPSDDNDSTDDNFIDDTPEAKLNNTWSSKTHTHVQF